MGVRPSQTFRFSNDGVDKHRAVVARSRVAQDRPSRTEGFHEALPQTTNQRMPFCSQGVSCMVSGVTFTDRFANALLIKQQRLSTCFECVVCCRAIQEKIYAFFVPGYFGKNAHLEILHMPPPIPQSQCCCLMLFPRPPGPAPKVPLARTTTLKLGGRGVSEHIARNKVSTATPWIAFWSMGVFLNWSSRIH